MLGSYVRFRDDSLYPDDFFEVRSVDPSNGMLLLSDIDLWVNVAEIVVDKDVKIFISKNINNNSEPMILNDTFNCPLIFESKNDAFEYIAETNVDILSLDDFFGLGLRFLPIKLISTKNS